MICQVLSVASFPYLWPFISNLFLALHLLNLPNTFLKTKWISWESALRILLLVMCVLLLSNAFLITQLQRPSFGLCSWFLQGLCLLTSLTKAHLQNKDGILSLEMQTSAVLEYFITLLRLFLFWLMFVNFTLTDCPVSIIYLSDVFKKYSQTWFICALIC